MFIEGAGHEKEEEERGCSALLPGLKAPAYTPLCGGKAAEAA